MTQTPQKKKQSDFFDTSEKNRQEIDKLKDMIYGMGTQHEKELLAMKEQI